MEQKDNTLLQLRDQEQTLRTQIESLEHTADSSSTLGIREFRRTRLRQLDEQRAALSARLRKFETAAAPVTEAYMLSTALRDASLVAASTFGR